MDAYCQNCLFKDLCAEDDACEHFSPVDDFNEDGFIDREKIRFRSQWFDYLEQQP